jgi:prevent-host-death family protein
MTSTVGIREAKINLSRILRRVRYGAEIVITDRGKPVGRIVPVRESAVDLDALVSDLEARGVLAEKRDGKQPHPPCRSEAASPRNFSRRIAVDAIDSLAVRHSLRGADLWHLAQAHTLLGDLPGLRMLTFDRRLRSATESEGLLPGE